MKIKTQLKNIASFSKGEQINGDDLLENGLYDYLNGGIYPSGKWDSYNTPANTVTISEGGNSCGYVNFMKKPFWCGAHCYYLFNTLSNTKYLYYVLKSQQDRLMKIRSGACMPNIKKSDLGSFEIVYETDEVEQKRIVEILSKCENIIVSRKQQLAKLDELVKARFVEMFGNPKSNNRAWKMNTFADICSVRQGLQIPISKRLTFYEEGCYEYITVAYLHGSKEREYIKNPKSTVICTKDDILMTRTGNTGMVITDVAGVFHNNFFLIDFDRTRYNKVFLAEYLNLDLIQAEIKRRAGTSTIPDLNHGEFYAISIYEPPIELQKQFAAFVEQVDKSKAAVQKALDEAQTLFDSLMQQYFG